MSHSNIIELNGKRYDAVTGKLLGESNSSVVSLAGSPERHGRVLDGVSRRPGLERAIGNLNITPHKTPAKKPVSRVSPHHVKPHTPKHSQTLMRRSVHKPSSNLKPKLKVQMPSEVLPWSPTHSNRTAQANRADINRASRAQKSVKHQHVDRFGYSSPNLHLQVPKFELPEEAKANAAAARAPHQKLAVNSTLATSVRPHDALFEAALAKAVSHKQPRHKPRMKRRSKVLNSLAIATAFLLIGGFFAYLNMSAIELKVASFHAGFNAQMPKFAPTGFALSDIANHRGTIVLNYRSGESQYTIRQQNSNWNSQTLEDTIIATAKHKTILSKGRTVYVYDNQASWVDGGVRYDISAQDTAISHNELVAIVSSL